MTASKGVTHQEGEGSKPAKNFIGPNVGQFFVYFFLEILQERLHSFCSLRIFLLCPYVITFVPRVLLKTYPPAVTTGLLILAFLI